MHAFSLTIAARSIAAILAVATSAAASSDEAWAEFHRRATESCLAASDIKEPRASAVLDFGDRAGKAAILISDRTKGRSQLCLYDKASRSAFIAEADGWAAPPGAPAR